MQQKSQNLTSRSPIVCHAPSLKHRRVKKDDQEHWKKFQMNFWKLKRMDLDHWKVKSNSIIFEAQTGGIKCNAWCRSVKTGELPYQEIKFKKKKTVQRPSVKKISFEKFSHHNEGQRASCGFFSTMWREEVKPGQRRCAIGLHGWFRLLCLEKIIQQQRWKNPRWKKTWNFKISQSRVYL